MAKLGVSLLGRLAVQLDGRPVEIPPRASQSLFAYLVLNRGTSYRRELLAGMFWSESSETNARNNLRHALWQIRNALGQDVFVADKVTVSLDPTLDVQLDVDLLKEERTWSLDSMLEAAEGYQGDLLPGFYEDWVILERERLRATYARLMEKLLEVLVEERRWSEVSQWAERWIAMGHVPEPAFRALMLAHGVRGDQAGVGVIYQRCVATLERELGVMPSPQTRSVHQRLVEEGLAAVLEPAPARERYKLKQVIGRGGMGEVYRAMDTWLDREVAIKVLSSEVLGPEGRDRLLREAQAAARLNHPNVVSVYDVGERNGEPFVVMELVEGQTLHSQRPEGLGELLAIAIEVCAALDHAHAQGIIHRDLKPENVMLSLDGMARLMDFGLASRTVELPHAAEGGTAGTVYYLAPEVLRGEPASVQSDLYAMGVLLYELLTGEVPFQGDEPLTVITQHLESQPRPPSQLNPAIRPALEALILRLLSKRPADRPLSAAAVAEVLEAVAPEEAQSGEPAPGDPPFKGLEHYDVNDAEIFFGREVLVKRLIERLKGERFLAVIVGASGSGKSSIVRAGLIPALVGHAEGRNGWIVRLITPTENPLQALAESLTPMDGAEVETAPPREDLAHDSNSLSSAARWLVETEAANRLLLVVDQFEELFSLCRDEEERKAFIENLLYAADPERAGPTVVVITLRADFYAHCAGYPSLRTALARNQEYIGPMSTTELRRAIEEPALRRGWKFQPGLVDLMLRDVRGEPGALPLLSHALLETWKRRSRRMLTLRGYAEAGGVRRAIARTAEVVYNQLLDEEQRGIVRNVFLRLTELGEGTEDTRRRVAQTELITSPGQANSTEQVLATLAAARLITLSEEHVEVAHEAVIREWPRLRVWLDEDREGLRIHRHLTEAAQAWEALDRDTGELYRGGRLAQALEWSSEQQPELNPLERDFLDASEALAERLEAEREAQLKRLRRRAVYLVGALVATAALAVAAGTFASRAASSAELAEQNLYDAQVANTQVVAESSIRATAELQAQLGRADAVTQELLARSREFAAAAVGVLDENPELSILLALESIMASPPGAEFSRSGVLALRDAMQANQLAKRFPVGSGDSYARITANGSTVFTWSPVDGAVTGIDVDTGVVIWTHQEPTEVDSFGAIGLSPDDSLVAVPIFERSSVISDTTQTEDTQGPQSQPGRIVILRTSDGTVETVLHPGSCLAPIIVRNGFSPDGRWFLVTTGTDGCGFDPEADWVSVYETATWEERYRLQIDGGVFERATFNDSLDQILVTAHNGPVELWSFPELELLRSFGEANAASLSPDGTRVVLTRPNDEPGVDFRPRVVDTNTGQQLFFLDAVDHLNFHDEFMFSRDGSMVVVTTRGRDYVFDTREGRLLTDLGEQGETFSASFTADGNLLLTAMAGRALIWDLGGRTDQAGVAIELEAADAVWINPNEVTHGPLLALRILTLDGGPGLGTVTAVLDAESGIVTEELAGRGIQLPDGRFVATLITPLETDRQNGPLVIWDPDTGEATELTDCSVLESILNGGPVECPRAEPFFSTNVGDDDAPDGAASVDGSFFAVGSYTPVGSERRVRVWDIGSLQVQAEFDVSPYEELIAAGPTWLAMWNRVASSIVARDVNSGEILAELQSTLFGHIVAQSPEGSLLYLANVHGGVWVFDTSTWDLVSTWQSHEALLRGLAISPDGRRLVTTGEDNFVKVWDVSNIRDRSSADEPPPLLDRIPAPKPSDAAWVANDRLIVFLADGAKWLEVSLSVEDLVADARARLTRSFTVGECAAYQINPCPTFEEVKGG